MKDSVQLFGSAQNRDDISGVKLGLVGGVHFRMAVAAMQDDIEMIIVFHISDGLRGKRRIL